jgi:glycerol kinase
LKITFGTGAFALAVMGNDAPAGIADGILPTVAWQFGGSRTYAVDAAILDAGSAVDWLERLGISIDEISACNPRPAIERGIVFVPAFSGLSCPHWDRTAAGLWLGLSLETGRADMCQALLEGIALRSCEAVHAMRGLIPLGAPIKIDGGLSRNRYFVEFLASALAHPVEVSSFDETTALGLASLAASGAGGSIVPPPAASKLVHPSVASSAWHARFSDATSRARNWRSPSG